MPLGISAELRLITSRILLADDSILDQGSGNKNNNHHTIRYDNGYDYERISDMSSISIAISYIISSFLLSCTLSSHHTYPHISISSLYINFLISSFIFPTCYHTVAFAAGSKYLYYPLCYLFPTSSRPRRKEEEKTENNQLHSFPRRKKKVKVNHSEDAFFYTRPRCQSRYPRYLL